METEKSVNDDGNYVNENEVEELDENGLNARQRHFAELYMSTGEVGKSYAIAYKKENNASTSAAGSRLAKHPKIVKYTAEQAKKVFSSKRIATEEDILNFLTSTMTNPEHKIMDRIKSAELLGKNKGLFADKIDITHDIVIDLGFDPAALIESSTNQIIEQKNKVIKHDDYYEADYDELDE
ncbi:hypothetical protein FQ085_06575 [Planococcus sp. ANT_H30]|uniref:terminase small subunit n=1 Tax=Planococcus sp. ANT_H30 TaxID=2597347 RepID=UPI0011EEDA0E|nr:terminase small subunit [Planococcus sp. ANT_H30]KAA0957711.1 hypothetical protein FQ085_06575 [Planococcus sp. ANT_H30]